MDTLWPECLIGADGHNPNFLIGNRQGKRRGLVPNGQLFFVISAEAKLALLTPDISEVLVKFGRRMFRKAVSVPPPRPHFQNPNSTPPLVGNKTL